jgi:hypothetical protein
MADVMCAQVSRMSRWLPYEKIGSYAYARGTIVKKMAYVRRNMVAFVAGREAAACVAGDKEDGGDRRKRARSGQQGRVTAMHVCVPVAREYVLAFVSTGKVGAGRKAGMAKSQYVGDGRP